MSLKILKIDPYLKPYEDDLNLRMNNYVTKRGELIGDGNILDFADGYKYFGVHPTIDGWVYREWAPAAEKMFFTVLNGVLLSSASSSQVIFDAFLNSLIFSSSIFGPFQKKQYYSLYFLMYRVGYQSTKVEY